MTFADDTKLYRKTKEIGDKQNLQYDIDKLVRWSEKWQMFFNFGKCKCLHIGPVTTRNEATPGNEAKKTLPENVANFVGGYIFWEPHTQK